MADWKKQASHLISHGCTSQSLSCIVLILCTSALYICSGSKMSECSRQDSRVARDILQWTFYPILNVGGWVLSPSCPLLPARDMYLAQEQRKRPEEANRWYCNYCGKAFSSENYLDLHFSNRHSYAILTGPEAVCLADHCDYLRCDVVSGAKTASYWDKTLCRQPDLDKLKQRCEKVVHSCVPATLTRISKHELQDKLKNAICSPLTCERYWEAPSPERSPHSKVAYAIATCILLVGLLLYYLVAYTHFYTDSSMLKTEGEGLFSTEENKGYIRNHYEGDIRSRYQQHSRR